MAKLNVGNPLTQGVTPPAEVTMEEVASEMYGGLNLPISGAPKSKMIPVDEIATDPTQPRRVIPTRVRQAGDVHSVQDVIYRWHGMSEELLGEPINVRALINKKGQSNDEERPVHGIVKDFLAVVKLAGDILRDGLINPITLIRLPGGGYKIETGERRWWAYQFLRVYTGDAKWDAIPATVSDKGQSVWRTAGENNTREELNGIAKARQLALIIMFLNEGVGGMSYNGYDFFSRDRQYYAQVADGNIHRIPKDMAKAVQESVGVGSDARISQIRRVLRLSDDVWDKADEEGWSEKEIRIYLQALEDAKHPPVVADTLNQVKVSPIPQSKIGLQNVPYVVQSDEPKREFIKPSPLQYQRPPMPDLQEDDEVLDGDGDEEMAIHHPFGGITSHDGGMGHPHDIAPSALENEQLMDYQSLLKSFLSTAGRDVAGDMSVLTRGHIRKMREQYKADEIAQILLGWENEISAVMEKIWSEAQAFNGLVYDIASKMKGAGDE